MAERVAAVTFDRVLLIGMAIAVAIIAAALVSAHVGWHHHRPPTVQAGYVAEDGPGWDCRTMGDRHC